MADADLAGGVAAAGDARAGALEDDVEVHAVDAGAGVVLEPEVDVLADAEAEGALLAEVVLVELELLDADAALEDLPRAVAADGRVDGDLLVAADAEGADGEAGLRLDGLLAGELLEHAGRLGELVAGLADADVHAELLDRDLAHRVVSLAYFSDHCDTRGNL